jgi:cation/acetate symporter
MASISASSPASGGLFQSKLARYYGYFTIGFLIFTILLVTFELNFGISQQVIAWLFLILTFGLYGIIGIATRTKVLDEYYVAGRSVPAIFNGMATGADWMSAASFLSMAGQVYGLGYDGLAYIMGWTGGYVLLALLFAPYIRKFGQYTIPDFVGARYGSNLARTVAAIMAIITSFTYVTAQVVGVGLVMSRIITVPCALAQGVQSIIAAVFFFMKVAPVTCADPAAFINFPFESGVVLGLAGVLFCSFLGGMKAVTWTQVAQYIILIVAYIIPVTFLSIRLTNNPIPQLAYGQAIQNVARLEAEQKIAKQYVPPYNEPMSNAGAVAALDAFNKYFGTNLAVPAAQAIPDTKKPELGDHRGRPWEFLALTLCLMAGTAGLPHILVRFYTVPSIKESRRSVFWALFFIFLLYFTAPAYAAFGRWNILQNIVGSKVGVNEAGAVTLSDKVSGEAFKWFSPYARTGLLTIRDLNTLTGVDPKKLPAWAAGMVTAGTLVHTDANADGKVQVAELSGTAATPAATDGVLQFGELDINNDLIVLGTPEFAGLPYTIAALVAAGGLAAALSTADGLLVVIASAVAHDVFFKMINPTAKAATRMRLGKTMILVAAYISAAMAVPRLAFIAQMVAWAFSFAASTFFPIVLLGIFWKRANKWGAIAGMIGGFLVTLLYMANNYTNPAFNIAGISHLSSGVFGMIVNFVLTIVVSKLTAEPSAEIQNMVERLRNPIGEMEETTEAGLATH